MVRVDWCLLRRFISYGDDSGDSRKILGTVCTVDCGLGGLWLWEESARIGLPEAACVSYK